MKAKVFIGVFVALCLCAFIVAVILFDEPMSVESDVENEPEIKKTEFEFRETSYVVDIDYEGSHGYQLKKITLGNETDIVIPSTYNGEPVVMIYEGVLSEEDKGRITSLFIPKTVEQIDRRAFENCSNLKSVVFEDGINLKEISSELFQHCSSLERIDIPKSVREIGAYAFYGCSKLSMVFMPDDGNLRRIRVGAFAGCESLKAVFVPDSVNEVYSPFDSSIEAVFFGDSYYPMFMDFGVEDSKVHEHISGMTADGFVWSAGGKETAMIYRYVGNDTSVVIPEKIEENTVSCIMKNAFEGCEKITEITIPECVESIRDGAFKDCTALESVTIPSLVNKIGNYAFSGCASLKSVGLNGEVAFVGEYAFANCKSLTSITSADSASAAIGEISNYAFSGCESLEKLTVKLTSTMLSKINDSYLGVNGGTISLTTPVPVKIGNKAFENCKKLKSFKAEDLMLTRPIFRLGASAFSGCESLETFQVSKIDQLDKYAFVGCKSLKNFNVSQLDVSVIAEGTFAGCSSLTSFSFANISTISSAAFRNCTALADVTFSPFLEKIEAEAFKGCTSIKSISIHGSVEEVGIKAFADCTELKTVAVNCKNVAADAFSGCDIESLTIHASCFDKALQFTCSKELVIRGSGSFNNNGGNSIKAETLVFAEGITEIGEYALKYSGITDITIPSTMSKINENAFYKKSNYLNVYYNGDVAGWCNIEFANEYANPLLYNGTLYIDNQEVKELVIPETVTFIKDHAFAGCVSIENIKFEGENVSISFGRCAFYECNSLQEIEITRSVETIGYSCFKDSSITKLIANKGVGEIESDAFMFCQNLKLVEMESVQSIGTSAFADCCGLKTVNLKSVKSIGHGSFARCTSLESILLPATVRFIGSSAFSSGVQQVIFVSNFQWKYEDADGRIGYAYSDEITLGMLNEIGRDWTRVS